MILKRRGFLLGAIAAPTIIGIDNKIQFGRLLVPPRIIITPDWPEYRIEVRQDAGRSYTWHVLEGKYPSSLDALEVGRRIKGDRLGRVNVYDKETFEIRHSLIGPITPGVNARRGWV